MDPYWIILALGGMALVVGYAAGVKRGRPWGIPLVVIATLVVIGLPLNRALRSGEKEKAPPTINVEAEYEKARALGKALASEVPRGCRVFFFPSTAPPEIISEMRAGWKKGLTKGLGTRKWKDVGASLPGGADAASFSSVLAEVEEEIDLVLFFGWVPDDLEQMDMYSSDSPPKVGLFFYGRFLTPDKWALIRQWLQKDLVQAVLVSNLAEQDLYTATNLADIPESGPESFAPVPDALTFPPVGGSLSVGDSVAMPVSGPRRCALPAVHRQGPPSEPLRPQQPSQRRSAGAGLHGVEFRGCVRTAKTSEPTLAPPIVPLYRPDGASPTACCQGLIRRLATA